MGYIIAGAAVSGALAWGFVMSRMPGDRGTGAPFTATERAAASRIVADVAMLADTIGERNTRRYESLVRAEEYLASRLASAGHQVSRQEYTADGVACRNLIAEIPGSDRVGGVVVVGAHYDTAPGTPGANDNGSGVAAVLELAALLRDLQPVRTLRFVLFVNEEPPFFQTDLMGAYVYARACHERGDSITAMLSIETIGYYSDAEGSQRYPFPISMVYPSVGDFIAFVANDESVALMREAIAAFDEATPFPWEGAAVPGSIDGVGWSDHWAFWQFGYPAIMLTDTAPFRYEHYHGIGDTSDKVDALRMARVVRGVEHVVRGLLGE